MYAYVHKRLCVNFTDVLTSLLLRMKNNEFLKSNFKFLKHTGPSQTKSSASRDFFILNRSIVWKNDQLDH